MEATVEPGEGEQIGGPTAVTIKATGDETNGSFYLGEVVAGPGFPGPPPHVHERLHDMFYVLDGTLTVRLGDETIEFRRAVSSACRPAWSTPSAIPVGLRFASSTSTRPQAGSSTCGISRRRWPRGRRARRRSARSRRATTSRSCETVARRGRESLRDPGRGDGGRRSAPLAIAGGCATSTIREAPRTAQPGPRRAEVSGGQGQLTAPADSGPPAGRVRGRSTRASPTRGDPLVTPGWQRRRCGGNPKSRSGVRVLRMGRVGFEPSTLGLRVPCSTN